MIDIIDIIGITINYIYRNRTHSACPYIMITQAEYWYMVCRIR